MRTIAKPGLILSLIIMIGLITFTGCQKEIEKVKVNTSGNPKSLIEGYGEFGNVALGQFYVNHLDRIAVLESFPYHSFEVQKQIIKEDYLHYFPEIGEDIINSVSPEYLRESMSFVLKNYANAKECVSQLCETSQFSDFTRDVFCKTMDIVAYRFPELAKGAKLNDYLKDIRALKKETDGANLPTKERDLLVNSMTIAYYAGIYWHHVAFNENSPWHGPMGVSVNAPYGAANGFSKVAGLVQTEIIGSGGSLAIAGSHPWPGPELCVWCPWTFPWPLPRPCVWCDPWPTSSIPL